MLYPPPVDWNRVDEHLTEKAENLHMHKYSVSCTSEEHAEWLGKHIGEAHGYIKDLLITEMFNRAATAAFAPLKWHQKLRRSLSALLHRIANWIWFEEE